MLSEVLGLFRAACERGARPAAAAESPACPQEMLARWDREVAAAGGLRRAAQLSAALVPHLEHWRGLRHARAVAASATAAIATREWHTRQNSPANSRRSSGGVQAGGSPLRASLSGSRHSSAQPSKWHPFEDGGD